MIKHIKRVGKNSIVFGFGTILTQALGLILIPVYTRVLTPADYGILSIIMVVQTILLKIYTSPRGAVTRFYFEYKDSKKELKKFIATTLFYSIGIALITSLILSVFGKNLFGLFAKNIPFKYIQFAIWIAFFGTVFPIVLSIYQALYENDKNDEYLQKIIKAYAYKGDVGQKIGDKVYKGFKPDKVNKTGLFELYSTILKDKGGYLSKVIKAAKNVGKERKTKNA